MISLLKLVPEKNFDICNWGNQTGSTKEDLFSCGTVCCAIGWACNHPPFIEQGLHWGEGSYPVFDNFVCWAAVSSFFDINDFESLYLFDASKYQLGSEATLLVVIDRLERFIGL